MNDRVNKKILKASGILALFFAASLLILGILELCVGMMKSEIGFIRAGERWSSDGEAFAVISLYAEDDSAFSVDQVGQWAYTIDGKLLESSVTPKKNARSWAYCYGLQTTLNVSGPIGNSAAEVMAVGGDFFVFHPLKFIYGSAFLNDNSNPMGVVLDRDLAWRVFGAENIIGMVMNIGGEEFVVTGITDRESEGEIYTHTYGERPRMYMSAAGYAKISGNVSVTMFETALPNPVKSFAKNIFDSVVRINEETMQVSEASDRFSLENRYENMKTLKYSWIRENRIELPYWENEARVADYRGAIIMIFEIAFAVIGVSSMLLSFIFLRISGYTLTDSIKNTWQKIPAPALPVRRRRRKKRRLPAKHNK